MITFKTWLITVLLSFYEDQSIIREKKLALETVDSKILEDKKRSLWLSGRNRLNKQYDCTSLRGGDYLRELLMK
jgi:hypothetical protein